MNEKDESFEEKLKEYISHVVPADGAAYDAARRRWDSIAKPVDGLGEFENIICRIAAVRGSADVKIAKKAVAVMCGDHGVVEEGVTQTDSSVTALVAENIARGNSTVNVMAAAADADVFAIDVGIAGEYDVTDVENCSAETENESRTRCAAEGTESVNRAEYAVFGEEGCGGKGEAGAESKNISGEPFSSVETEKMRDVSASAAAESLIEVEDAPAITGKIWNFKVKSGTENMTKTRAMSREEACEAIFAGIKTAERLADSGYDIIAVGEMGIGNTTPVSAITCVLSGKSPAEITGRGAGLSDEGLRRKINAVERALALHNPDRNDALDILSSVGGLEIAAMTGVYIGAARRKLPAVTDASVSCIAAVLAVMLCPECRDCMIMSIMGKEPASEILAGMLGLKPVIFADMALGEATGAVMLFPLIETALAVYRTHATFEDIKMEAYERFEPEKNLK